MSAITPASAAALARALQSFGFDAFLPGQEEAIQAVMQRHDTIFLKATDGGKSLVIWMLAKLLPGTTLVFTPLVSLMRDQVRRLTAMKFRGAACLNSTMPKNQQQKVLERLRAGQLTLLYIAPERLQSTCFLEALRAATISSIGVDECHCVSSWGSSFRPDFLAVRDLRKHCGSPPIFALTATATPDVRTDIIDKLGLINPRVVISDLSRPNLHFHTHAIGSVGQKLRWLKEFLKGASERGRRTVVYFRRIRSITETSEILRDAKINHACYHSKLAAETRSEVQEAVTNGSEATLLASVAFAMGVDIPGIDTIVHFDYPDSLDLLWHQAGRAGRGGVAAECHLLVSPFDHFEIRSLILERNLPIAKARARFDSMWAKLSARARRAKQPRLKRSKHRRLHRSYGLLSDIGLIAIETDHIRFLVRGDDPATLRRHLQTEIVGKRRRWALSALAYVWRYCELASGHSEYIVDYLQHSQVLAEDIAEGELARIPHEDRIIAAFLQPMLSIRGDSNVRDMISDSHSLRLNDADYPSRSVADLRGISEPEARILFKLAHRRALVEATKVLSNVMWTLTPAGAGFLAQMGFEPVKPHDEHTARRQLFCLHHRASLRDQLAALLRSNGLEVPRDDGVEPWSAIVTLFKTDGRRSSPRPARFFRTEPATLTIGEIPVRLSNILSYALPGTMMHLPHWLKLKVLFQAFVP